MNKLIAGLLAAGMALTFAGSAHSGCGTMNGDCGNCAKATSTVPDQFKKYQQDTLGLRQEMMNKRFDMQRENLGANPDKARLSALRTEITAIQAKIMVLRKESGLPDNDKRDGECDKIAGCDKWNSGDCGNNCLKK